MNELTDHQEELRDALREHAEEFGERVSYERGAVSIRIPHAVRGNERTSADRGFEGLRSGEVVQEWIVEANLIKSSGNVLTPQREDAIVAGDQRFRVLPAGQDGPLWRKVDRSGGTFLRIFTRERS